MMLAMLVERRNRDPRGDLFAWLFVVVDGGHESIAVLRLAD